MKKFENVTLSNKEKAIKIGKNAPKDSVNIAWFNSDEVNPSNSISIIDYSYSIPENKISENAFGSAELAFADELGVLRRASGSYVFPTNNITVSDVPLSYAISTRSVDASELDATDYVHYKYVSRYFISAPNSFSLISETAFFRPESLAGLNVRVVDRNGFDYVDQTLGRKKYRILLEPYRTDDNVNRSEIPHRVIVLLDSTKPDGLRLVYDKIESDDFGNVFNMELNYSEPVNAVTFFEGAPEESFVIDGFSKKNRNYSIQKLDDKYSSIVNNTYSENGYQVFVPNKAFNDYRTYEIFNWRFIARNRVSLDFDRVNYGSESGSSDVNIKTINVGVLYSSSQTTNASIKPYVFQRLNKSPFNLFNYDFVNPNAVEVDNTYADYWKVNIDDIDIDLNDYDVLAWCPNSKITAQQAIKLNAFLRASKTLILDLSSCPPDAAEYLEGDLTVSSDTQKGNEIRLDSSPVLEKNRNGAWELLDGTDGYAQSYYGIWGSNNKNNNFTVEYKDYRYFNNPTYSFAGAIEDDENDAKSIAMFVPVLNAGDSLSRGNILVTTFNLMDYCNSIYDVSTNQNVLYSNFDEISLDTEARTFYSGVVEGPFKLLFNACSYALYSSAQSKRIIDERSSVFNFVSDWKSSWVMNQNALLDEEKNKYYTNISSNTTTQVFARDLTPDNSSFLDHYKTELATFLSRTKASLAASYFDNVELFIEITNPDVTVTNTQELTGDSLIDADLPSSYSLYRVIDSTQKVYTRTDKSSPVLQVFSTYGDYVITEKPISVSDTALLRDNLNALNSFASYPFNLSCTYTYAIPGPERSSEFVPYVDIDFSGTYSVTKSVPTFTAGAPATYKDGPNSKRAQEIKSAIDDLNLNRATSTSNTNNIFPYTGDIDLGNKSAAWRSGQNGEYATYVQYTLWTYKNYYGESRNYYPYNLDTNYGPLTAAGVRSFQQAENERYIDGIVDSETKWYMAKFWKLVKATRPDIWRASTETSVPSQVTPAVINWIKAAANTASASEIGSKTYRKTTFTGTVGPGIGTDVLFFKLPQFDQAINGIEITADDGDWGNYSIVYCGLRNGYSTDIFSYTQVATNVAKSNGKFTITIPEFNNQTYTHGFIFVEGRTLNAGKFGYAEGFGIKDIQVKGKSNQQIDQEQGPEQQGEDQVSTETLEFFFEIDQFKIDPALWGLVRPGSVVDYSVQANATSWNDLARSGELKLKSLKYNGRTYDLNLGYSSFYNTSKTINIGGERDGTLTFRIASQPRAIRSQSYTLNKVTTPTGISLWENGSSEVNPVSYTTTSSGISFSTSGVYFADGIYQTKTKSLSSGYFLKTTGTNSIIYGDTRSTININDGTLLFCKEDGSKYGFPTQSEIQDELSSVGAEETDLRYGSFILNNSSGTNNGFIFGFYDVDEQEFLGNRIEYVDFINKNIFIGIAAIDADGNSLNENEYIGSSGNNTFRPVEIPLKYIAPIYSVVMHQSSAIKVNPVPAYLSKFDCWELPITNGSFKKEVLIDGNFSSDDWKNTYRGQRLKATYSTTDLSINARSKIYGNGYYDVYDEQPVLLDDRNIRVRRTPILSWNHPTTYSSSIFGIVKPVITVYKRETLAAPWVEIPYSQIKNIDCQRGTVEFKNRTVPSDPDLIKVSYTTEMNYNFIKQSGGQEIPINPVLSYDLVSFNQPLYVYLNPKILYREYYDGGSVSRKERVAEYIEDSVVGFTYDASIFNSSSSKFDPLALLIATVYVLDKPQNTPPNIIDSRTRGGGVVDTTDLNKLVNDIPEVLYNWDVYSADGEAYNKGGYVIIRIPESVKENFVEEKEIYNIISNNLTAGIVFEIQDMQGNTWS